MKKSAVKTGKRDNSIIFVFSILALFIVALVGFNFDNVTTSTIRNTKTTLDVVPKFLNAGQYITISVSPGKECVNGVIGIYDDSGSRKATAKTELGTYRKICQAFTIRYKTSPSWKPNEDESGIFFVKVFDYEKKDYVTSAFTING